MISRVNSNNKEKKAKRKNSVKKRDQTEKNGSKKQKTALPGVEPGLSVRARNRPFALRGHVTSFYENESYMIFFFKKRLVGPIFNKIIVIWFS